MRIVRAEDLKPGMIVSDISDLDKERSVLWNLYHSGKKIQLDSDM